MSSLPAPPDHRPYRRMSEPGPSQTLYAVGEDGRVTRLELRQIGWQGQTGALYSLGEDVDPKNHEPGSWSPTWAIAHSDDIDPAWLAERIAASAKNADDPCSVCGCTTHSCCGDCDCCAEHRTAEES